MINPRALFLGLYTGQLPIELICLTKIEKNMVSLINIVQHFVSDVVAEASGYGKFYSKVYASLNNVTNIANQLPNMVALDGTAYIKK